MQQPPNYPGSGDWQQPQYPPQTGPYYPSQQSSPQWPGVPQQPNTHYPPPQQWQQPQYQSGGLSPQGGPQFQQQPYQPQWQQPPGPPPFQVPPPPKKSRKRLWLAIGGIVLALALCGGVIDALGLDGSNTSSQTTQATTTTAVSTEATIPQPTDTPTPKPTPTVDPAQVERLYKILTKNTTVDSLDKDGNVDKGKDVHFTCKLLRFVKDDSGNTGGANVESPDSYSTSVIQVVFPSGADITKLNEGDTLEVWGTDEGVFSGKNAFGGDVQEVGIGALYITDITTNYQAS